MLYKVLMLILLSLFLSGCSSLVCIFSGVDHLLTPSPKAIPGVYKLTLTNLDNGDSATCFTEIEHFYDGGASTRGNRWEVRYKAGVALEPLKTKSLQDKRLEVPFPSASNLLNCDFPYSKHYVATVINLISDQNLKIFGDVKTGRYYYYSPVQGEKIWMDLNLHIDVKKIN